MYPRIDNEGRLVGDDQVVAYREHLLCKHRTIFLAGIIGGRCLDCGGGSTEEINLMLALGSLSSDPIRLFITSVGGDLDSAFLLYDTMRLMNAPVITVGRYCASAAALLLAAGTERYLFPHAKVMLHDISGSIGGFAKDIEIQHTQIKLYKQKMVDILLECGARRTRQEILIDIDRNFWLEPREAIEYGLADKILDKETLRSWLE